MAKIRNMGTATMRFGEGIIVSGSAGNDTHSLIVSGSTQLEGDINVRDIATYNTVEYFNSNTMKFNQYYLGNAAGSYFSANEYQKVLTIIPSGNSENYQVIGRITAQNAGETHVIYFNAALRSGDPLPDLSWSIFYDEEYNGSRYIDPQLWTKETTTAGFIIAFKTLGTIYGNVTVDIDVVPRNSSQKPNVTINDSVSSEQTTIDAGYTANDMTKIISKQSQDIVVSGDLTVAGNDLVVGEYTGQADLYLNAGTLGSRLFLRGTGDAMSAGDNIGAVYFDATENDGVTISTAGWMIAEPTSTTYTVGSDMPTRIKFGVCRDGQSSPTDTLYIDGSSSVTRVGILDSTPSYTLDVNGDIRVTDDLFVDDFARIDALRVGTTSTDPGDGNLYVENDITVAGEASLVNMPGYILTYRSWGNVNDENSVVTVGSPPGEDFIEGATNGKANITFTAPSSGNVELEFSVYIDQVSPGANLLMSLSQNGVTYTRETGTYFRVFDGDETDDGVFITKWTLTGLTAGVSYQYWFGAYSTTTNGITLRWGDGGSLGYPPLIMKATTLPSSIS